MQQRSCNSCEYNTCREDGGERGGVGADAAQSKGCPIEQIEHVDEASGCFWVRGLLRDSDHPSQLGVVIGEAHHEMAGKIQVFIETKPGALMRADVQRILRRMLTSNPVMIRDEYGSELLTSVDDADMLISSFGMMAA